MKKILFTSAICLLCLFAKAQIAWNYAQYDLGFAGAINSAYSDAETIKKTNAVLFNFTYNHTPFFNYVAELQFGKLAGGDHFNTLSGREFKNQYVALSFRPQLQAGEFIDYANSTFINAFKNLYISAGVGVIFNDMKEIERNSLYIEDYTATGLNTSTEFFVPVKVGYEFKLYNKYDEPSFKIDLGYQHNFILGDQMDGIKAGIKNDAYGQWILGLKFAIGGITSYRKQISRYQY
ncbi:hypothetical protein [Mucilaginibacter lacusdianchii]|uniref:hypothetical protein n=1 Tax=Mucilaginibacter lacusdianchii TaxID=2684211 RepID=UPI00131E43D8|nr:hypothetical protein [Mucilaginibacter sp. JXJ CY 39]